MRNTITKLMLALFMGASLALIGCQGEEKDETPNWQPEPAPSVPSLTGTWRLTDHQSPGDQWVLELTDVSSSSSYRKLTGFLSLDNKRYVIAGTWSKDEPATITWSGGTPLTSGQWTGSMSAYDGDTKTTSLSVDTVTADMIGGSFGSYVRNKWSAVRQ